eukprot:gnl/MRDRNA2_/MRDRNA2_92334_c0_seq1.p1 gnl/MRDRNA2_/MRDRNA2_92334_c0~~gnl/MRDRNA2_/MRDRNA2_92334_c0_seq1.p1  ORF type:complete len:339 (+),score=45.97 gnl/MRDRNA2_/MRDRNA2_92334_c0_seq1:71-1087(+)
MTHLRRSRRDRGHDETSNPITGGAPSQHSPSPFRNAGASVMHTPRNPMPRVAEGQRQHVGMDGVHPVNSDASWVPRPAPSHYLGNGISNAHGNADGFFLGQHAHAEGIDHLGTGLVPRPNAPQYVIGGAHGGNADGFYMGQHAGKDVAGNLGAGLVPKDQASHHRIGHARGYIDGVFVGQHSEQSIRNDGNHHSMGNAHRNTDGSNIAQHARAGHLSGMVPRPEASQYVIGNAHGNADGFYSNGGQHAGKIVRGNLGTGLQPTSQASQHVTGSVNVLADDLYGGVRARRDVATSRGHSSVPPFDVADAQSDLRDRRHRQMAPSSNDWAVHHCPWQQKS